MLVETIYTDKNQKEGGVIASCLAIGLPVLWTLQPLKGNRSLVAGPKGLKGISAVCSRSPNLQARRLLLLRNDYNFEETRK